VRAEGGSGATQPTRGGEEGARPRSTGELESICLKTQQQNCRPMAKKRSPRGEGEKTRPRFLWGNQKKTKSRGSDDQKKKTHRSAQLTEKYAWEYFLWGKKNGSGRHGIREGALTNKGETQTKRVGFSRKRRRRGVVEQQQKGKTNGGFTKSGLGRLFLATREKKRGYKPVPSSPRMVHQVKPKTAQRVTLEKGKNERRGHAKPGKKPRLGEFLERRQPGDRNR